MVELTAQDLRALEVARLRSNAQLNGEGYFYNPQTGQMTSRELLANNMKPGVAESAAVGMHQGLSFGFGDEVQGAAYAAIPFAAGTPSERYTYGREYMRAKEDAARRDHPVAASAGEVGGAVGTGLAYGLPAFAGKSLPGAMGAGALVGGAEGVAYGLGTGEGGLGPRAANAAAMGGLGAATGGALPIVTTAAGKATSPLVNRVFGGKDGVRASRAGKALTRTMERSGQSVDDISAKLSAAAADGQPEYVVADAMGDAGARRLSGLYSSGGGSSDDIKRFLNDRQIDQPGRVSAALEDAYDLRGTTAQAARAGAQADRKGAADIAFGGIRGQSPAVDLGNVVAVLDDSLKPFSGKTGAIPGALRRVQSQLVGKGDPLTDFDSIFAVRRELRDSIDAAYRNGRGNLAEQLRGVQSAIDDALAAASPEYRKAMQDYAEASRAIDAFGEGAQMARPGARAADTTRRFDQMNPAEQAAARAGYGDRQLARVEAASGGTNRARPLTSPKSMEEARRIANDPGLLDRRIGREMEMFETRNTAIGGSPTAAKMEDVKDIEGYDVGLLPALLRRDYAGLAGQAAQRFGNVVTGMNDATRRKIADAMLSNDVEALRAAVAQVEDGRARRMIADTALREMARIEANPRIRDFFTR